MKLIGVLILSLLLMTQTFSTWLVVVAFRLNREYIANNLCENRTRPQLNCKGNCVLMKKMKQDAEQEKKSPAALKIEINTNYFYSVAIEISVPPVFDSSITYFITVRSGQPIDRALAIFHPPSA